MSISRRVAFGSLVLAGASFLSALPASAAHSRRLDLARPSAGIETVSIDAGVGDVTIRSTLSDQVVARVDLKAKNGWFGTSRSFEDAQLRAEIRGGRLELEVDAPHHGSRDFEETWTIEIPRGIGVALDLGVGDVSVEAVSGGIDLEVGVGDVAVRGDDAAFDEVEAESGVGEISVRQPGGRREKDGVLGNHVSTSGRGRSPMKIDVGVGDVEVDLR